jgi:uncharacterized damage-inducible protein DinB
MKPTYPRPQPGDYHPYHQRYLDLVPEGETDALACLRRQGLAIMEGFKKLSESDGERRYAPGKWSVKEVLGHMVDTERVFVFRALWIARGEPNEQPGMDEVVWGANSNAGGRRLDELWREHHVARTDHLRLLRSFEAAARARRGRANGVELAASAVPWLIAGHELHHLAVLGDRYGIDI